MEGRAISPRGIFAVALVSIMGLAAGVVPGALAGSNEAEGDALFTNGVLHVLRIDIPRQGMQSLRLNPRQYVTGTLREGPKVWTNVLIRLKGGAGSFRHVDDKPGLTLNLRDANGRFHGLRKFHLNNSVQDDTFLSEWFSSELFREAGVPAGRVAHAVLELNGRRLGLYVVLESINSEFLANYFENSHGNVYSLGANADVGRLEQMGGREETSGAELRALAATAREPNLERLQAQLPRLLDLPSFLSFMATEVMLDHWDGYTFNIKNYVVYHDVDADKIVFMPHDLDQVLRNPVTPVLPSARGVVARAILKVPDFRAQYRQRVEQVFTDHFVAPVLIRRIDQRVAQLAPQLRRYDPALARAFTIHAGDLKARIVRRAGFLSTQFRPGR